MTREKLSYTEAKKRLGIPNQPRKSYANVTRSSLYSQNHSRSAHLSQESSPEVSRPTHLSEESSQEDSRSAHLSQITSQDNSGSNHLSIENPSNNKKRGLSDSETEKIAKRQTPETSNQNIIFNKPKPPAPLNFPPPNTEGGAIALDILPSAGSQGFSKTPSTKPFHFGEVEATKVASADSKASAVALSTPLKDKMPNAAFPPFKPTESKEEVASGNTGFSEKLTHSQTKTPENLVRRNSLQGDPILSTTQTEKSGNNPPKAGYMKIPTTYENRKHSNSDTYRQRSSSTSKQNNKQDRM